MSAASDGEANGTTQTGKSDLETTRFSSYFYTIFKKT